MSGRCLIPIGGGVLVLAAGVALLAPPRGAVEADDAPTTPEATHGAESNSAEGRPDRRIAGSDEGAPRQLFGAKAVDGYLEQLHSMFEGTLSEAQQREMAAGLAERFIDDRPAAHGMSDRAWTRLYRTLAELAWSSSLDVYKADARAGLAETIQAELREMPEEQARAYESRLVLQRPLAVSGMASHLARQLERGYRGRPDYETTAFLAHSLATPKARRLVRGVLVRSDGSARLLAAQLLAWAHRRGGELGAWRDELDARLAEGGLSGDARASWLLARAYVAEIEPRGQHRLAGRRWLHEALGAARSQRARLRVLGYLVDRYVSNGNLAEARSLLASTQPRYTGAMAERRFAAWRQQIAERSRRRQRGEARAAEAAEQAWRDELQRRLRRARQDRDREAVRRYERLLTRAGGS